MHQVSENKMFRLNESLEINTKKLCNLNESSDKSAKSLQASGQPNVDWSAESLPLLIKAYGVRLARNNTFLWFLLFTSRRAHENIVA